VLFEWSGGTFDSGASDGMVYRRSGVRFQAKATTQACKGELHCEDRQPVDALKGRRRAPYQKITCGPPKVPCRILRHCGILQKIYANGRTRGDCPVFQRK
jgi:hypothetical protein